MHSTRFIGVRVSRHVAFAALVMAGLVAPSQAAPQDTAPEVSGIPHEVIVPVAGELPFSKLPYAEARAAATAQDKLFVVDATATWCGPCRQMEAEAWPVAEVGAWVAAHAVAVQLDVDEQKEIAMELKIAAMPTIIVFRGDTELDRHTGRMDAAELLTWFEDVAAGRAGEGPLLEKARALLESDDYKARYDVAKQLQQRGQDELALQHYLWLWPNTRGTSFSGVRSSFMLSDMKRFADSSEPAREAFAKLFEEIRQEVAEEASPDRRAWREFDSWCSTFEHPDALLAWYEAHGEADGSVSCAWAADTLFEHFIEAGSWTAAGQLGGLDARATAKLREASMMEAALAMAGDPDMQAEMKTFQEDRLREDLSRLCAAAWAVGRDDEGRAIAGKLLAALDDSPTRLQLVTTTLDAVGARPEQVAWLDEAAAKDGDAAAIAALREKLQAAASALPAAPLQPASPPEPVR